MITCKLSKGNSIDVFQNVLAQSRESHLAGHQFHIPWSKSHCRISHDLCFDGAQASCGTGLNKAVQHYIQQVCYLKTRRKLEVKSKFLLTKLLVW